MEYYAYIVECADGTFYVGSTNDLVGRVAQHNAEKGGAKYTRGRQPVTLRYSELYATRSEALKREYALKQLRRADKLKLIKTSQTKFS